MTQIGKVFTNFDNQAESAPMQPNKGSTVANWNSGYGTSGKAGADVVNMALTVTGKITQLDLDVSALTAGGLIYVQLFKKINGVEQMFYEEPFTIAADTPGLSIITDGVSTEDYVRCEVFSTKTLDDGLSIGWEWYS